MQRSQADKAASMQAGVAELRLEELIRIAHFRSALRRFLRESERKAQRNGLTPQRYQLLLMIKGAPDGSEKATVTDLAQRLQLAQGTVTELVQRAVSAGLVKRQAFTHDARVTHLRLTEEGERRLLSTATALASERERLRAALE